jgi:putative two-component system response regulator
LVRSKAAESKIHDHAEKKVLFSIARTVESRDPNTGRSLRTTSELGQGTVNFSLCRNKVRDLMWVFT